MLWFIVRRSLGFLASLFLVSIVIFGMIHFAPGDPLDLIFEGGGRTPEAEAAMRARYHLDKPIIVQYWYWLSDMVTGDFGRSIAYGQKVSTLILSHGSTTLALVLYTMVIIVTVGMVFGLVSARYPGIVDRSLLVVTGVATAIPPFVAAVILIGVFALGLGWFPTFGEGDGLLDQLHHMTLPAVALAVAYVGMIARVTRMSVMDELARPHVEVARLRGVGEATILRRHVLRNAIPPIMTIIATRLGSLIGGTTVVETAFGISGLGSLLVRSVARRDFPVIQAIGLLIVAVFAVALILVDILHARMDPRLTLSKARQR